MSMIDRRIIERFQNKEVKITFDDGGKPNWAKGTITSVSDCGFILLYRGCEQYFPFDCVGRIREVFKGDSNGR